MKTLTIKIPEDVEFSDDIARKLLSIMQTKIETLNDRTKRQTIQIRELRNKIKEKKKHGEI